MSIESTGRSKERHGTARPQKVIRLARLPEFLGVQRSVINEMVKRGLLNPFNLSGGGRSKVVTEAEVIELQTKAQAEAKAKKEDK